MSRGRNFVLRTALVAGKLPAVVSADLLYAVPAEQLAEMTGVDVTTARRWKRRRSLPEPARRLLELQLRGDLGTLAPAWEGWTLSNGQLTGPDGLCFSPAEVLAAPFIARQVQAYQAEQRFERQADWVSGRWETHRPETADVRKLTDFLKPAAPAQDYSYLGVPRRLKRR